MAQIEGRPAVSPEITCSNVGLGETKNPGTLQHFVETWRPPRDGKDVASSEGGNEWDFRRVNSVADPDPIQQALLAGKQVWEGDF